MYTFIFLMLLILPIFNGERLQNELDDDDDDDLLVQRSVADSYLFSLPIRRYKHRFLDIPDSFDSDDNHQSQPQRTKRIYWENLAFHASDYNKKGKKV